VLYRINLAPCVMVTCLHCGEAGPQGALFCPKCGFTLPQGDAPGTTAPPLSAPARVPGGNAPASVASSPLPYVPVAPPGAYAAPVAAVPGAVGPIRPPPLAKYCVRCGTLIAQPAVYCPVCQQPQP
jgi:RNA polymerase subunit RPABC4/transcription elongation factor Spt4